MTEEEWMACTDPEPMLEFLCNTGSERKTKLFATACCRRIWHLLTDVRSRNAVEVAERFADDMATEQELRDAEKAASEASGLGQHGGDDSWHRDSFAAGMELPAKAGAWAVTWRGRGECEVSDAAGNAAVRDWKDRPKEFCVQADILRDIFGNPFRPVTANPAWPTPSVVALAQSIYDDRAFERLPELSEALVAARCDNQQILDHCRSEGQHVRGCWAVDLILGKE